MTLAGIEIAGMAELVDALEPHPLRVEKRQTNAHDLNLRVNGVSTTPSGHRVYRMVTRDGHYVGRTNATRVRARKGDVLKVQASDLLQDVQGDMRWTNPNVIAQYNDAPHSWRELTALAGGELEKDGPPAGAAEIPPAGDQGDNHFPSGPTLEAVHIPAPLPNISIGYQITHRIGRKKAEPVLRGEFLPVSKAMAMKQLVYGVVLEPNSLDAQNDYMLPKAVEATAHGYLKRAIRGTSSVHKLAHRGRVGVRGKAPSLIPVESFIAPIDFSYDGKEMIKAGSWVLVVHVEDPALWQDFLDGKYQAFSVGGTGVRQSLTRPEPEVPRGWITSDANDWRPNPSDLGLSSFI